MNVAQDLQTDIRRLLVPPNILSPLVEVHVAGPPACWKTMSPDARQWVARHAKERFIQNVWAVNPSHFNGELADTTPKGWESEKPINGGPVIHYGHFVDGLKNIPPYHAFWVASGDCHTVILSDDDRIVPCHAGLDCLVPRYWIDKFSNRDPARRSVVQNACSLFDDVSQVRAAIILGIGELEYRLDDPTYGVANECLQREFTRWGYESSLRTTSEDAGYMAIDLVELIRIQLRRLGVPESAIWSDGHDTFSDRSPDTDGHLWWSHSRAAQNGDAQKRNLVFVARV